MKSSRTKRIVKYLLIIMVIYASFYMFLFSLRFFLGTEFPIVVVEDVCMVPALNPGDLAVLKGVGDGSSIRPQDIIVFYYKPYGDKLIIHRVLKVMNTSNTLVFITHGDNNPPTATETVREEDVVGIYTSDRVPAIGKAIEIIQSPPAKVFTAALLIILVVVNVFYDEETLDKSQGKIPL
jgi:signal peptidase I